MVPELPIVRKESRLVYRVIDLENKISELKKSNEVLEKHCFATATFIKRAARRQGSFGSHLGSLTRFTYHNYPRAEERAEGSYQLIQGVTERLAKYYYYLYYYYYYYSLRIIFPI